MQSVGGAVVVDAPTLAAEAEELLAPEPAAPVAPRRRRPRRARPAATAVAPAARTARTAAPASTTRRRCGARRVRLRPWTATAYIPEAERHRGAALARAAAARRARLGVAHRRGGRRDRRRPRAPGRDRARRDARRRPRRVRELAGRGGAARRDPLGRIRRRRCERLGLVRREEADDLALRVAQLEHRVRLLETAAGRRVAAHGCRGDNVTMETARPQRRIGRLSEIGRVATRHGFGYLIDRRRSNDNTQLADRGRRLREMLDELGPTFVKFGQLLSTRPDVMPPDIVAELRNLQDDVTPIPFADVRRVIEEELGLTIEQAFLSFDETPIAAASIGQVHRATLPTGDAGRRQGAAAGGAAADRVGPAADAVGGPRRARARARARLHRRRGARRRVRAARSGRSSTTSTRPGTPRRSGATSAIRPRSPSRR